MAVAGDLAVALPLAVLSSVSSGISDFAGGMAARQAHILRVLSATAPTQWLVTVALIPVMGVNFSEAAVLWGLASGVASTAAFGLFYKCLAIGPMGLLAPLAAVISALLPVAVGLAAGETLGNVAVIGVVLAVLAAVLISWSPSSTGQLSGGGLACAIGAGFAIALQLICLDRTPADSGLTPLVAAGAISTLLVLFSLLATGARTKAVWSGLRWSLVAGLLGASANVAFLAAVRNGPLSIVAVIVALYPAATIVLAHHLLAERFKWSQVVGVAAAAFALVAFTLSP